MPRLLSAIATDGAMLVAASALVALACIAASAMRLRHAVAPTALDARMLLDALRSSRDPSAFDGMRGAVALCPEASWERDLFEALACADDSARLALVNEQLLELDWSSRRWERAPRVCASVATSAGFFFASIALLIGLARPTADAGACLVEAVNALSVGLAATAFCVAVHVRARAAVRDRMAAVDRLVAWGVEGERRAGPPPPV